jgi:hypothetical protein
MFCIRVGCGKMRTTQLRQNCAGGLSLALLDLAPAGLPEAYASSECGRDLDVAQSVVTDARSG